MLKRLFHIVLILLLLSACGHRSQEMSEALLRAEEMNRNYQSMDTLKGMEQVADYYRPFLGRSQRYMRALYMLGCVYRDRGDAPMALHYYQEAVSQADTTDADCDYYALGKKDSALAIVENSISQYAKMKERGLAAAEMGFAADFHINLKSATYRV